MHTTFCNFEWADARTDSSGLWAIHTDDRGVLTMSHPYEPSAAGNLAEASFCLPAVTGGRRFLRFYLSDTYAGHETGNTELGYPPEYFPEARFASVSVGQTEIFRCDLFGPNPPIDCRFHQVELPPDVDGSLIFRAVDAETIAAKFAVDVFWGLVSIVMVPDGSEPPPFTRTDAPAPELRPCAVGQTAVASLPSLTVTNHATVSREEVVSGGVPFAPGVLLDPGSLRVRNASGGALPMQRNVLATWPDGSVKSLLVHVPVTVGAGSEAVLRLAADDSSTLAAKPSMLQRADGRMTVDTGSAVFVLAPSAALLEQVSLADGSRWASSGDPLGRLANYDGFPSRFVGNRAPDRIEVLEEGPLLVRLRVEGAYEELAGAESLRYEYRLSFRFGSADIRLQHTIWNAGPQAARLRTIAVRLGAIGLRQFDLDAIGGTSADGEAWLVQHTTDRFYTWRHANGDSMLLGEGTRNRGWAVASGKAGAVGVSLRHMWEQHPNGFRIAPDGLQVDLWTSDRVPWVLGSDPPLTLSEGEAKTHDLLLGFGAGSRPLADRLAAFQYPLFPVAPPEWYCGSGLFGSIAPADPDRFPEYEAGVAVVKPEMMGHGGGVQWDRIVDHTHEDRATYQRYGFRNYGDNPLIWGYQTKYRMWANCEYDVGHCALTQFARSGDLRYLHRGISAVLHNRDTDFIHASPSNPEWVGSPHGHWIDHTDKGPNLGHLWSEGMVEHYLLTGDERSLRIARGLGDNCVRFVEAGWSGSSERTAGWPMIALLGVYHGTGDVVYLDAARRLVECVIDLQDDLRGVWSSKIYEQPAYEGGTTFMVNILCRALMRYHVATDDTGAATAVVRGASWMLHEAVTDVAGKPESFYKQTPLCSRHGGSNPETFAYAYALSGDPCFRDLALRSYAVVSKSWAQGVPTSAMRDLPRVLALLAQ